MAKKKSPKKIKLSTKPGKGKKLTVRVTGQPSARTYFTTTGTKK